MRNKSKENNRKNKKKEDLKLCKKKIISHSFNINLPLNSPIVESNSTRKNYLKKYSKKK